MQGRITKVLNMKPPEILSMIEEAAGTSMYEQKREHTTKLMEKKDGKLQEMEALLKEEIEPKLEKLRDEQKVYKEFQQLEREIEYLNRINKSHLYLRYKEGVKNTEDQISKIQQNVELDNQTIVDNENEVKNIENVVLEIQQKIDDESGGQINELDKLLNVKTKEDASNSAKEKSTKDKIQIEDRKVKALLKSIKDDEVTLQQKENEMSKVENLFQNLKDNDAADAKSYEDSQKKFEAVSAGLSTNEDGEAASLQDQLMTAKQHVAESQTAIKKSEMELKQYTTLLRDKQGEQQTNDTSYLKDKKLQENTENEVKRLHAELAKINYEDGQIEELKERKNNLTQDLRQLKNQIDQKGGHRFDFKYSDPEANFDRSAVKGMVIRLFDVRDKKNCLALGVAAGGSLYSVITDNDITSKKILQNGRLQSRTTMIPLNKISGRAIERHTVKFAQDLVGKENVAAAIDLVEYDKSLEPAMRHVFGTTLICRDMNIAKQVTFHRNIMCRSVTLEGDSMDPNGSLSGGSRPKGGAVLLEANEINQMQKLYREKEAELRRVCDEITKLDQIANRFNQFKEQLELRNHELQIIKQRLSQTSFEQHQTELADIKTKIESLKEIIVKARETQTNNNRKAQDIQFKLSDSKGHRERELKSAEQEMKDMKKKSEESRKNWKKHEQQFETLKLEIEELKKGIASSKEQVEQLEEAIKQLQIDFETFVENCGASSNEVKELKAQIKEQKDKIHSKNKELKTKSALKEKLLKNNQELLLEIKKKENEITKVRTENKENYNKIKNLEEKYTWILEDQHCFGMKNTRYDYSKENPNDAGKKVVKMIEDRDRIGRSLNKKAMALLQREEEQYDGIMKRKKIVEDDKNKIKKIILELDEKKRETVKKAWHEIDKYFGQIFSSLLPGAEAKLTPPDGKNFLLGLEVKIGFNGMWKESLTELSGGQRSLVALSLILAMLKYKPAPLYILDEVDAALDLSHTQNIGNMLKTHFKNAQVI